MPTDGNVDASFAFIERRMLAMTNLRKFVGSAAVIAVIAVGIVLVFTLARHADGYVDAAPIVQGEPEPMG